MFILFVPDICGLLFNFFNPDICGSLFNLSKLFVALCFIITYFYSLFDFSLIFLAHCLGKSNKETHRLEHEARVADKMVVNHADLMRTNPGFRELTRAGVPQKRGTDLYRTVYTYTYHDSVLNYIISARSYTGPILFNSILHEFKGGLSFLFIVNS